MLQSCYVDLFKFQSILYSTFGSLPLSQLNCKSANFVKQILKTEVSAIHDNWRRINYIH